jgi:RNA-dependent RNA polymerase
MRDWEGSPNWHGGQVQQRARLEASSDNSEPYVVRLEALESRRSNRVARFFGSRHLLQLNVPPKLLAEQGDEVRSFINGKKFVLCGRVFMHFHAKDNSVYLIETNEDFERSARQTCGDQYRISFSDFIKWHNPLERNFLQV